MTVKAIINNAIKRLENEGKLLTPDIYMEAFCRESAKAGVRVEDCMLVDNLKSTLNKEFQKELEKYSIRTISELSRFLISKLNRTNPSHCATLLESQTIFTKRVLQVVGVLHNKEAEQLAKKSIDLLNREASAAEIDQYRQLWVNFITTYDDSFLQKLKTLGEIDSKDLKNSVLNLKLVSNTKDIDFLELSLISSLLVSSLVPSIASSANDKIVNLSQRIQSNPKILESREIESEIKSAISLRIALDKQSVNEMLGSLDSVLDKLSIRLIEMIESSDTSAVEIQKIKKELELYNLQDNSNFSTSHKKLYTIALALEENTQNLSKDLKNHSLEVKALNKKIETLENELLSAKEESKEDFLTKLYNKRALDEFIGVKEAEYERHGYNFSIIMFDLDHFKAVNDTYGHDAGDAVLTAFAKILKSLVRSVDIVGRFGGEEFIAILSETDTIGGANFAEKVRTHVQKARFMYKGERMEVTVSCGVSERAKHTSMQALLKSADEHLYAAKKNGRNQVVYKK